ncbi:MAG: hypothetical protein H6965_12895 [Chromatiaceae bacterium]|nr:hypothetical protein [Chromatiaceae bacterium]
MKEIIQAVAVTALFAASSSASAFWGGPWGNNGLGEGQEDGYADGSFNFNMSASGRGHGYGRGDGQEYFGYPYAPYPHALPLMTHPTETQLNEMRKQQEAVVEQHAKALQAAVEAEREHIERFANSDFHFPQPFAHETVPFAQLPFEVESHDVIIKQMDEHRKAMLEQVKADRKSAEERRTEMRKSIEARRANREI